MKIYNFEQRSPEWDKIRELKLTGSNAQAIGNNGAGLITYVEKMVKEYFSKEEIVKFRNKDMDRGNELEEDALTVYSFEKNIELKKVGFVLMNRFVGVSPDTFANKDGLAEAKAPNDVNYKKLLKTGKIDSKYIWQMQMQMLVCEKKWCDFIAYNPNFKKSLYVQRIFPNSEKYKKLEIGFETGIKLIKKEVNEWSQYYGSSPSIN